MTTDNPLYRSIGGIALATGLLLLIPLIAMQFSDDVVWTASDFLFMGILLFSTGLMYKLITRHSNETVYRISVGFALFTGFLLIWVNLAVGIIGSDDNPINSLYFLVIFVGIIGAIISRFRPGGLALTMFAVAGAHALITAYALFTGVHHTPPVTIYHVLAVNGFFITLFAVAAMLFRYAAEEQVAATGKSPVRGARNSSTTEEADPQTEE